MTARPRCFDEKYAILEITRIFFGDKPQITRLFKEAGYLQLSCGL